MVVFFATVGCLCRKGLRIDFCINRYEFCLRKSSFRSQKIALHMSRRCAFVFYYFFFVRIKIIAIAVVTIPMIKAPIAPCIA